MTDDPVAVGTPLGPAHAHVHPATRAVATVVLGHGAGRGTDTRDLLALAAALPAQGVTVIRVDQPWVVAGRKVAPSPATLDRAWTAVMPQLSPYTDGVLVVGGRSAGARVACRTATAIGADAVLAIAFPLHPPGKPERSRGDELAQVGAPLLILQGSRDAFGRPEEFPSDHRVHALAGADHGLAVSKRAGDQDGVLGELCTAVRAWIRSLGPTGAAPEKP